MIQENFSVCSNSADKTVAVGRQLASLINIRKGISIVGVRSNGKSVGKSTLLYGLVSSFTGVTQEDFHDTQVGALARIYKAITKDYFIVSYDAYTWRRNPLEFSDDKTSGLICVEHVDLADLDLHGLKTDIQVEIRKPNLDFHSPRQITVQSHL